jgi:large subunit ribosomal protein L24
MNKLLKGDEVIVITGSNKGRRGKITARISDTHLLIEGINTVKKHQRPNPAKNESGGIVTKSLPIHQSNIAVFNSESNKADRVVIRLQDDNKKIRVYKSTGQAIQNKWSKK